VAFEPGPTPNRRVGGEATRRVTTRANPHLAHPGLGAHGPKRNTYLPKHHFYLKTPRNEISTQNSVACGVMCGRTMQSLDSAPV
jgi:hypothetical protein